MKVTLKIMGPAKRNIPENPSTLDLPDECKVIDMMISLGYTDLEARRFTYVRQGIALRPADVLAEGDLVQAVLQMGGG